MSPKLVASATIMSVTNNSLVGVWAGISWWFSSLTLENLSRGCTSWEIGELGSPCIQTWILASLSAAPISPYASSPSRTQAQTSYNIY